jgi:hypothetical protein
MGIWKKAFHILFVLISFHRGTVVCLGYITLGCLHKIVVHTYYQNLVEYHNCRLLVNRQVPPTF